MKTFPTLCAWLEYLQANSPVEIEMGLARIGKVSQALGLRFNCPIVTVGGTNGKGSVCAMLEAILLEAGYKVGCYTSPHFLSFNERARINGQMATDPQLLPHFEAVERARCNLLEPVALTHFEFITLAVMRLFTASGLNAIILEVGLGGRLDAVNIMDADCAIVTSVDIDHTQHLGDTRERIGFEKAGIFRPGRLAICSDPAPPHSLIAHAKRIGADLWLLGRDFNYDGNQQQWNYVGHAWRRSALAYPALRGINQLLNASAVLAVLEALRERLPVSAQDIRSGLLSVKLPGRFQVLPGRPTVILDVAHNPHAAAALAQNLKRMGYYRYTYAVFGAMRDKDIDGIFKHLLASVDHWYLTDLPVPRAASAAEMETHARAAGFRDRKDARLTCFAAPTQAYAAACAAAGENDRIIVFGSFHTVGSVMAWRTQQR